MSLPPMVFGNPAEGAPTVIVTGNCQPIYLAEQLARLDDLNAHYRFIYAPIYAYPADNLPVDCTDEMVRSCVLYLRQYQDTPKVPNRDRLEARLPKDCPRITFPSFLMTCFWPFEWPETRRADDTAWPIPRYPHGDMVALEVAKENLPGPLALAAYLDASGRKMPDMRARFERDVLRMHQWDGLCDVKIADYVLGEFRRQHLFWTYGHVSTQGVTELTHRVARAAQPYLGGSEWRRQQVLPWLGGHLKVGGMGEMQVPIDPRVAQALGLEFGGPDQSYLWFTQQWDFREYMERYIAYDTAWPPSPYQVWRDPEPAAAP